MQERVRQVFPDKIPVSLANLGCLAGIFLRQSEIFFAYMRLCFAGLRVAASCFFMPFFASFFFAKLFSAMLFFEKNLMIAGQTAAAVAR